MNKKIILFAAGAVLLAASAFTFASVNKSNDPMNDLFKANVEALASGEVDLKVHCSPVSYDEKCEILVFLADGTWRYMDIPRAIRVYFVR